MLAKNFGYYKKSVTFEQFLATLEVVFGPVAG
jgi:hypothetical protein